MEKYLSSIERIKVGALGFQRATCALYTIYKINHLEKYIYILVPTDRILHIYINNLYKITNEKNNISYVKLSNILFFLILMVSE